jgi:hypothetical protein
MRGKRERHTGTGSQTPCLDVHTHRVHGRSRGWAPWGRCRGGPWGCRGCRRHHLPQPGPYPWCVAATGFWQTVDAPHDPVTPKRPTGAGNSLRVHVTTRGRVGVVVVVGWCTCTASVVRVRRGAQVCVACTQPCRTVGLVQRHREVCKDRVGANGGKGIPRTLTDGDAASSAANHTTVSAPSSGVRRKCLVTL